MLINFVQGEECRIAITEDGRLEELYQERASNESHVGSIYKGRVQNVEPSIQAAFVDFGLPRNGFLHITDLHPMYFPGQNGDSGERVGKKTPHRERPPIQKCLRRGQEILVQVLKEGIGTKGPTLTSYLSIPGRFLVMMPYMEQLGVSRKVEDDEARREMRKILDELKPPDKFGFIVRTAGIGRTKADLKRDLAYLQRLWKAIERNRKGPRVGELYAESDLIIRTLRDVFSSDIDRIIIDHEDAARRARDFLAIVNPRSGSKVLVYRDPVPLFHRFGIEPQIENISARTVPLKSGGSLVIDQTEALVAIDVNSGRSRESRDAESTAYHTNMEAVDEICRQLRLRDLGGVIVNDLIDMRDAKHRREVEAKFKANLKHDRAKTRVLSINQFGILELTRQRMRPSLQSSTNSICEACTGRGHVKSAESVLLDVTRRLALVMHRPDVERVELTISPDVAFKLLNFRRKLLTTMEEQYDTPVLVRVHGTGRIDEVHLVAFDARGVAVDIDRMPALGEPKLEPVDDIAPSDMELDEDDNIDDMDEQDGDPAHDGAGEVVDSESAAAPPDSDADDAERPAAEDHGRSPSDGSHLGGSPEAGGGESTEGGRRRRRRRRGGRGRGRHRDGHPGGDHPASGSEQSLDAASSPDLSEPAATESEEVVQSDQADSSGASNENLNADDNGTPDSPAAQGSDGQQGGTGRGRRRRRRGRRGRGRGGPQGQGGGNGQPQQSGPSSPNNTGDSHPGPVHPVSDANGNRNPNPFPSNGYRNELIAPPQPKDAPPQHE